MGNTKPVYVIGHRNPDTDSICAAIAYAYLKNQIDPTHSIRQACIRLFDIHLNQVIIHLKIPLALFVSQKQHILFLLR